jgi:hypothetical protein
MIGSAPVPVPLCTGRERASITFIPTLHTRGPRGMGTFANTGDLGDHIPGGAPGRRARRDLRWPRSGGRRSRQLRGGATRGGGTAAEAGRSAPRTRGADSAGCSPAARPRAFAPDADRLSAAKTGSPSPAAQDAWLLAAAHPRPQPVAETGTGIACRPHLPRPPWQGLRPGLPADERVCPAAALCLA